TLADAVMDRILHRSYELEISGRSYREKIYAQ
ncbi:ATP-binding protein, partial [Acinetobacter baumannii]